MVTAATSDALTDGASVAGRPASGIAVRATRLRVPLMLGIALVVLPLVGGIVLGRAGLGSPDPTAVLQRDPATLFLHNLGVAAWCAGGLVTFGLGTVLTAVPAWFVVGTQIGAALAVRGGELVARGLAPHGVVELAGFACAVAVGVLPVVHLVDHVRRPSGPVALAAGPTLRTRSGDALVLAGLAVLLLALAAVLETRLTPLVVAAGP